MSDLNLDFLDQTLDKNENKNKNKNIKKIGMGYKLYDKFRGDPRFSDEVTNSALDPDKRCYRGVRIKITHDDYELTFIADD